MNVTKAFPATNRPEPSQTWIKKHLTCACGREYDTGYWMRADEQISKPAEMCNSCQNRADNADRIKASEAKLPEVIQELKYDWLDNCGLPTKYFDKTFDNFDSKLQSAAFEKMKSYGIRNDDDMEPIKSIVLSSGNIYGVGKTHLVAAVINRIIKESTGAAVQNNGEVRTNRRPIHFTTEAALLNRIRATYNHHDNDKHETEEDVYKELLNIRHLFIDDVGKVRPKDYSFLQGVYYQIIDGRYCNESPIVLTTNLGFTELEAHIGGACADRLNEMCGKENLIKMTGKSQRK